jgi:hypothetical protein
MNPSSRSLLVGANANLAWTASPIHEDILKHHISRYNDNKNARQVCHAWRNAISIPSKYWVCLASETIYECADRLLMAASCTKVDFSGPTKLNESVFVDEVLTPSVHGLNLSPGHESGSGFVFRECTHMRISWLALKQINIFVPKLRSLELVQSRGVKNPASEICDKIISCFPKITKFIWRLKSGMTHVFRDFDAADWELVRDRVPGLRAVSIFNAAPLPLILNDNSWLDCLQCSIKEDAPIILGVKKLCILLPATFEILPSKIVEYLRIQDIERHNPAMLESLISQQVFPNLRRLRLDLCLPHMFEMILSLSQVLYMNIKFASFTDAWKFIKKCADQSHPQLALSGLIMDITNKSIHRDRIKWAANLQGSRQKFRDALLSLIAKPHLPQLRRISISELFMDGQDLEMQQQLFDNGISFFYRTVEPIL